jgi:hypothetical protein
MGKGHARNEDTYLNKGGENEVSAAAIKYAVEHPGGHTQNTDTILKISEGLILDVSQTNAPSIAYFPTQGTKGAQTFKCGRSGTLNQINLFLSGNYEGGGNITIEIRSTALVEGVLTPTETVLATTVIDILDLIPYESTDIIFVSPTAVIDGTTYAIVFYKDFLEAISIKANIGDIAYPDGLFGNDGGRGYFLPGDGGTDALGFFTYVYTTNIDLINDGSLKRDLSVDTGKKIGGLDPTQALIKNTISGSFDTNDGQTVTFVDGQITDISPT